MEIFTAPVMIASLGLMMLVALFFGRSKHIRSLRNKHVFIMGGSSGIGFSIAKACLSEGAFVTLVSRTHTKLASAYETLTKTMGYPTDHILIKEVVVSDGMAISSAIKESFSWKPIDMLICNAGQIFAGELDRVKVQDLERVIRTNILGYVLPLGVALPLMKSRSLENPASIVLMGSLASLAYNNNTNVYTLTKHALKGLADYLRIELMPYNISVSLACPADRASQISDLLCKLCFYKRDYAESPDDVANKTIEGAKRGDALITTNFPGFVIGTLARGWILCDSFGRALVEIILFIPARILSIVMLFHMKKVLCTHLKENLDKNTHEKETPYVHSIDDSAAADDANLDLWSH